jgi:hypothetical protein
VLVRCAESRVVRANRRCKVNHRGLKGINAWWWLPEKEGADVLSVYRVDAYHCQIRCRRFMQYRDWYRKGRPHGYDKKVHTKRLSITRLLLPMVFPLAGIPYYIQSADTSDYLCLRDIDQKYVTMRSLKADDPLQQQVCLS